MIGKEEFAQAVQNEMGRSFPDFKLVAARSRKHAVVLTFGKDGSAIHIVSSTRELSMGIMDLARIAKEKVRFAAKQFSADASAFSAATR